MGKSSDRDLLIELATNAKYIKERLEAETRRSEVHEQVLNSLRADFQEKLSVSERRLQEALDKLKTESYAQWIKLGTLSGVISTIIVFISKSMG